MTTIITMAILILIIKYDDYVYDHSHSLPHSHPGVMILDNFETAMLKFWDYFENYFG